MKCEYLFYDKQCVHIYLTTTTLSYLFHHVQVNNIEHLHRLVVQKSMISSCTKHNNVVVKLQAQKHFVGDSSCRLSERMKAKNSL